MSGVGFEPTIPVFEGAKTVHATVISLIISLLESSPDSQVIQLLNVLHLIAKPHKTES
jgi:hypothetical protein